MAAPTFPVTGGCLCGAIRYELTMLPALAYACHCTDCQTQSASAFALALPIERVAFRITKGTPAAWQRASPTGDPVVSWFCGTCACRIFGERASRSKMINVRAGTLDDTSWIGRDVEVAHIWTRSMQPWVRLPADAIAHPTQPADFRAFLAAARGRAR